jgi:hypothetical protein
MATLPSARTNVSAVASAFATGSEVVCVFSPCATNADMVPRQYGSASAVYAQHGYCEGVEYAALHAERTGKPFIFVGLPIGTAGAVGRHNTSGNTGTSVSTISVTGSGALTEHEGKLRVKAGGTVGTDQITLEYSLDNGLVWKSIRLGTATTYTFPMVGVQLSLAAGTLIAGETIHTWFASGPRSTSSDWATARANLAAQAKLFRSLLLIGDVQNDTEAAALLAQADAYATSNARFIRAECSVLDRLPYATLSKTTARMTGSPTVTFAEVGASGDTITRSAGSFITDGFAVGDVITVTGSSSNNVSGPIASLTATVITLGTTDLNPEGPVSNVTIVASPSLTFAEVGATGDTVTRNKGSWLDDGFRVGDSITFAGTASNNVTGAIAALTATVLTFGTTDVVAEVVATSAVTATAGQTKAAWMTALEAEFQPIDSAMRISLGAGRGRVLSPFTGWNFRRSVAWADTLRAYQHDLHIPTHRKNDGNTRFDLYDSTGTLVEWDDRVDGAAGVAARFTCFRTYNSPAGAYIALALSREADGSLLSLNTNVDVVNHACTINQAVTENFIGRSLVLDDDGHASRDSLNTLQAEVNSALELELLVDRKGEGQRASKAVWTPSSDDILNVPDATITGVLDLQINGIIHSVVTSVRVR